MISWTSFTEEKPIEGSWILVGYWFTSTKYREPIWYKHIRQYSNKDTRNRKVTHWTYLNPPN